MEITSLQNKQIVAWSKLDKKKYRDQAQQFIIEEDHLIEEARKINIIDTVIARIDSGYEADIYVSDEVMKKLSSNRSLNNVIAVCHYFNTEALEMNKVLVLDNVQDPGNVGTLIRTAYSFGFNKILLANQSVDMYNEKLIKASQGAVFHASVENCSNIVDTLNHYKHLGYHVMATALDGDTVLVDDVVGYDQKVLILGNEGSGVSQELLELADQTLYIQMENFESLNVGIAGGIIMYLLR